MVPRPHIGINVTVVCGKTLILGLIYSNQYLGNIDVHLIIMVLTDCDQ